MIDSTCSFELSVNFSPAPENTLMPLSSNGLCEAEMTTPAVYPMRGVRYAMAGVGMMPAPVSDAALARDAKGELALDPGTGFTRVAAGQETRAVTVECTRQRGAESTDGRTIERVLTRLPANAVGTEETSHR